MVGKGEPPGQTQTAIYRKEVTMKYGGRSMVGVWLPDTTQQLGVYIAARLKMGTTVVYSQAIEFALRSPDFLNWLEMLYLDPQDPKQQTLGDTIVEANRQVSDG